MAGIGGNTEAIIQVCGISDDEYGVEHREWKNAYENPVKGFLDLEDGGSSSGKLLKRVEDSNYIFLCDYFEPRADGVRLTTENSRLLIDGEVYEVKLYDDVMRRHEHMEIYLKYLGGQ